MKHSRKNHRSFAFFLLSLGQMMCILDISIVNIAIPSIQRELHLSSASLHWIVTAYVLTYGGFLLVGGRLGDLFGRARMFLFGLGLFTVASAIGGMAQNLTMLALSRAGQGIGGAILRRRSSRSSPGCTPRVKGATERWPFWERSAAPDMRWA